ncbi:MAG: M3 family oligoendopeptidase [Candidatus Syntrophosphaera sp.]|nr:M3 family oligoendopeptidase [Candidatus Syntrophosphaera sp.]
MAEKLTPIPFKHLPEGFDITSPAMVEEHMNSLLREPVSTPEDLILLMEKYSDLLRAVGDELSWRYIRMTVHADDPALEKAYNDFFSQVVAPLEPMSFQLKKLFYASPQRAFLPEEKYAHLNRMVANDIELFREENVPLKVQESELANKYGGIVSKMTAEFEGREQTPAQLSVYLKDSDRQKREAAWRLRLGCFAGQEGELNDLYDELRGVRSQIAANAGFANFRDYKHAEMGRFSYSPDDLYKFHAAVEKVVVPFVKELDAERVKALKLDTLRPWDTAVDLDGRKLQPFETTEEFIGKSVRVLEKVKPAYARQLRLMDNTGLLDLENRKGKAPGGYNTSISNLGSSFIFMNHVKLHGDVVTLLHESGHAMHAAAMKDIQLAPYADTPSEVAELASMSMELLSMDHWDEYYKSASDLKKAKKEQLEGTLSFLPWCMTVDAFQHWVYLHPEHGAEERKKAFLQISGRFSSSLDWSGLEDFRHLRWLMQLHIFEVPFYYIEYGMTQLGALSIYMNYRHNKDRALRQYQDFLDLGYSRPVSEIYRAAGIEFDFSEARIGELVDFVKSELAEVEKL